MEHVRHDLSLVVRVDDAFLDRPVVEELDVRLVTGELPVRAPDHDGPRQQDGTYRFIDLPGAPLSSVDLQVISPRGNGFTHPAVTPLILQLDPAAVQAVRFYPSPRAAAPAGVIAVRGVLVGGVPDQLVTIEPTATSQPARHTYTTDGGEFLFVVAGWTEIDPATSLVSLRITTPSVTSVDVVLDGATTPTSGNTFAVPPGRETRVRFHI